LARSLGRADRQRHAGGVDLARRARQVLAPQARLGGRLGVLQEVAAELAVAVTVRILAPILFPQQHQGDAAPGQFGRHGVPVRSRPGGWQLGPLEQQRFQRLFAHFGHVGVAHPSARRSRQIVAHRRLRHSDRLRDLAVRVAQLVGQPQKFLHASHV
jgi:hypothetical protein